MAGVGCQDRIRSNRLFSSRIPRHFGGLIGAPLKPLGVLYYNNVHWVFQDGRWLGSCDAERRQLPDA